jgi:hypothetical protein
MWVGVQKLTTTMTGNTIFTLSLEDCCIIQLFCKQVAQITTEGVRVGGKIYLFNEVTLLAGFNTSMYTG